MSKGSSQVVVIGGGYTGLAAAFQLAQTGFQVTLLESDDSLGGLAGTFEISPGCRVEKFYHHWFLSDSDILGFLDDLGLGNRVKFNPTNTGLYFANQIFRLSSPWDLLTFRPLPLIDRIRTGLMAIYARGLSDWKLLEDKTAKEWIIQVAGKKSYDLIWGPLLQGKFGSEADQLSAVWFWNKLKLRGASRKGSGQEQLAYFDGGFGSATDCIAEKLESMGVKIRTSTPACRISVENGAAKAVQTNNESIECDHVICTTPLPVFLDLVPELPQEYRRTCEKIRFLGNACLVLRLSQSLSKTYWLNVADVNFPFVGVIEHTNFDPVENYGGAHIAYLSRYLSTADPVFAYTAGEFLEYSLPYLKKLFPDFSENWILSYNLWKSSYSQPIVSKNFSSLIPQVKTPISGIWLATMAQIYPEDRGTNYAVRAGRAVAHQLITERS